ncbi:MAG: hypothetical protein HKN14_08465 [Marinicaulis sp.]|nr:hypothetical protein [Marinicaulis sp.]NNE40938.1 hypothetical protein [Marinicaulis sp.]NNL87572.1 hypothetical protein [Marinicaulis sp.]
MLLRRITEHVKAQNWFAVALDFVIVVVGVLLAFQITSWSAARGESAKFERQVQAVRLEMLENLERHEFIRNRIENQATALAELRTVLADPLIDISDEELDALLWQSILMIRVHTKRSALDTLLSSDLVIEYADKKLVDEIEDWEASFAFMNKEQDDALQFRNMIQHRHYANNLSYASVFQGAFDEEDYIAPPRFRDSRDKLSNDAVLENILVGRQVTTKQDLRNSAELVERTRALIAVIEEREAR